MEITEITKDFCSLVEMLPQVQFFFWLSLWVSSRVTPGTQTPTLSAPPSCLLSAFAMPQFDRLNPGGHCQKFNTCGRSKSVHMHVGHNHFIPLPLCSKPRPLCCLLLTEMTGSSELLNLEWKAHKCELTFISVLLFLLWWVWTVGFLFWHISPVSLSLSCGVLFI